MCIIMNDFKQWCDLLSVQGAINATQFLIKKLYMLLPKEKHCFKYGGYLIVVAHVVVDCKKRLLTFALVCQEV